MALPIQMSWVGLFCGLDSIVGVQLRPISFSQAVLLCMLVQMLANPPGRFPTEEKNK